MLDPKWKEHGVEHAAITSLPSGPPVKRVPNHIVYRKLSTVGGARIWVLDGSNIIPRGFWDLIKDERKSVHP